MSLALSEIATEDFQKRGDRYPSSGKPVSITVHGRTASFEFKNTTETEAKKWVSNYLRNQGFVVELVSCEQTGDYDDDWVTAHAITKAEA
jgi:hypothetical protein